MTSSEAATTLWCVVAAAGSGARFGGDVPKQYLDLAGKPLLLHTLEALASHPSIAGIVLVRAAGDERLKDVTVLRGKPILSAIGGATRADSVLAGLQALPTQVDDSHFVLVHDAARPCVTQQDISRLLTVGIPAGGALLAAPLRDTLKRADSENRCVATESRDARWRAMTPQLFRNGALRDALLDASRAQVAITDEAMAMERMGHKPLLVEGDERNIKVTTPADFAYAAFLLQ